jgi:pyruvate formate lyase activating enzyme
MKIGGLLKLSLIDYPGKIAAVIFTQGCNFRCPYCHNPELVLPENFCEPIEEGVVFDFLRRRKGQIEGVVVTGGEPTMQKDLIEFLGKVKEMGYSVKLDTNGSNPEILQKIVDLHLADYIAMDIKASLEKYPQLTPLKDCVENINRSINIILGSQVAHEFRTTLAQPIISEEDLPKIVSLIKGTQRYRLQRFIPRDNILNKELLEGSPENFSEEKVAHFQNIWGVGNS